MRTQQRPRRYIAPPWLLALKPVLRYSATRDAFVLRGIGNSRGPVLRVDRRSGGRASYDGAERRSVGAA
ncbi:MAG TPA: hypothetical protein VK672_01880 [Solirubrobacteraceae bacterium]|jgi:hypothetical protein|nr:hypothetical protein [Solirubrobacteraceae bacterium]